MSRGGTRGVRSGGWVFLACPQASCPCPPHETNPCAGVQAAPDSIAPLSPSVSLWCSLAGGHSLLQPADPPDMRAQESDLRLRHRLHHQRHAHRSQPGPAQRHEIGTAWALPLVHTVHGPPPHPPPPAGLSFSCTLGHHHCVHFGAWRSSDSTPPALAWSHSPVVEGLMVALRTAPSPACTLPLPPLACM